MCKALFLHFKGSESKVFQPEMVLQRQVRARTEIIQGGGSGSLLDTGGAPSLLDTGGAPRLQRMGILRYHVPGSIGNKDRIVNAPAQIQNKLSMFSGETPKGRELLQI